MHATWVSVISGGEIARTAPHSDIIRAGAAVQGEVDAFESPDGIRLHAVLNTLLPLGAQLVPSLPLSRYMVHILNYHLAPQTLTISTF